jgi:hypothetical protein
MVEVKRYNIKVTPLKTVKIGLYENTEAIINQKIKINKETKKVVLKRFFTADLREMIKIVNKIKVVIPKEPSSLPNFTIIPKGVSKE